METGETSSNPRQVDKKNKKNKGIFNDLGLNITIDGNLKIINFLDICMDLYAGAF